MLEILLNVFANYLTYGVPVGSEREYLIEVLISEGFEGEHIDEAFVWVDQLLDSCEQNKNDNSITSVVRSYTNQERQRLGLEGQSLLIRLVKSGVLDALARETVIERVMALDTPEVTLEHVQWVILMVMSNQPDFEEITDWAEMLVTDGLTPIIH